MISNPCPIFYHCVAKGSRSAARDKTRTGIAEDAMQYVCQSRAVRQHPSGTGKPARGLSSRGDAQGAVSPLSVNDEHHVTARMVRSTLCQLRRVSSSVPLRSIVYEYEFASHRPTTQHYGNPCLFDTQMVVSSLPRSISIALSAGKIKGKCA